MFFYYWVYWVAFDIIVSITFLMGGFWFYRSEGEGCKYLTGHSERSLEDRLMMDEEGLCRRYGKRFMCWAIPFIIAAPCDILMEGVGCVMAWFGWIFMFAWHLFDRVKREVYEDDDWW